MLAQLIKEAAMKVAAEARQSDDLAKLQFAVWLARRAAGIEVPRPFATAADDHGVIHVAARQYEAYQLALAATRTY